MLDSLISNETRLRLVVRLFLNHGSASYLHGLEQELGISSYAIRFELNRLEVSGIIISYREHNRKRFMANKNHPMYNQLNEIIQKRFVPKRFPAGLYGVKN